MLCRRYTIPKLQRGLVKVVPHFQHNWENNMAILPEKTKCMTALIEPRQVRTGGESNPTSDII